MTYTPKILDDGVHYKLVKQPEGVDFDAWVSEKLGKTSTAMFDQAKIAKAQSERDAINKLMGF